MPNRERREYAVILSVEQYACGIGFDFNGADCPPSEQVASKNAPASACEKSQLIHCPPFLVELIMGRIFSIAVCVVVLLFIVFFIKLEGG